MDRFKLKVIMIIFMLLDHMAVFFDGMPIWFRYVGRVVLPVFLYLLVEGYFKTSSRNNYLKRLLIAAEIMFLGNSIISIIGHRGINGAILSFSSFSTLAYIGAVAVIAIGVVLIITTYKKVIITDKRAIICIFLMVISNFALNYAFDTKLYILPNNIFLSLAAAFVMLNGMVQLRTGHTTIAFIKILVAVSLGICTESLIIGPAFAFIFYKCFNNRRDMYLAIIVFSALFLPGFNIERMLEYPFWMMVFSIPFIFFYNGKKGRDLRGLFYSFYPVHIWILYGLSLIL
ncbi:MAG: TraX family protein [Terrisporobacter sp.]